MPVRSPLLLALVGLALTAASFRDAPAEPPAPAEAAASARRVVSMNPSLTEMLVALGAAASLVGVDEYSARLQPEVRELPTVGGLFNPSLEAIVGLEPDLVVLVPSAEQRGLRGRLEALGIPVLELPNIGLGDALASIEILGVHVGRAEVARVRVSAIRRTWDEVARAAAGRARVRTVFVLQRDPLFVVGRGSFIDSMLDAAGAENLGAAFDEPYPRAAVEWLIAAGPELILDATENAEDPVRYWSRWPSLPAVAAGRTLAIRGEVIRPGPYLDRSLRRVAEAVHGADLLGAAAK